VFAILLAALLHDGNQKYEWSSRWRVFCEKHLIDWDRNDPATKKWLDEQEKQEKGEDDED
jgi:hypothetical protein